MLQPFDAQLEALTGEIKWLSTYSYKSEDNRLRERERLIEEFKKAESFPLNQMTPRVWDELNEAAHEVLF